VRLLLSVKKRSAEAARDFASYVRRDGRADAMAGLTVAVMGVPQAMAYALIVGLPPVYGLYTAIVSCAVGALFGSSNHLVTGPTNALCMVILTLTARLPEEYGVGLLEAILLLSFMTGLVQLAFGMLRLGKIVRYVSNSVVIGFTAGAGVLIAINQLKNILGIDISGAHAERSYEVLAATLRHVSGTNFYALGIGVLTMLIAILMPRIDRRLPGALIAVTTAGVLSYLLGWHETAMGAGRVEIVQDIEPIRGSLNIFHIPALLLSPDYNLTRQLGTGALALAILSLIETTSISRTVAASSGQRLNFSREFVGQGTAKIVGSFFSCFAGSGSLTRTMVCYKAGGRTRMAAIFSALWTALTLLLLGPFANYIPKASLAGILIVVAYSMVDKRRLKQAWRAGKNTRLVLVGTLVSTLALPLEYAIFFGVILSVVMLLRVTGRTDLTQLVPRSDHGFEEVPFNRAPPSPIVTVNMEGYLYFAAAEDLDYELLRCITPVTRVVVLRMKRLSAVGSTAMAILEHFWEILRERNIYLVVCGIEDALKEVMTNSGLRKQIGEQNIFYADNKLFQSTELALARASSIVEREKRLAETRVSAPASLDRNGVTAADIMSRHCIRFGQQHQLREAVWLMSEMLRETRLADPQPLFLQDREGKLAGKLSPWRLLSALGSGLNGKNLEELDDPSLGELFRKDFGQPIASIARIDCVQAEESTGLAWLLETAVENNLQSFPVCDQEGRITGLVTADDLLRGLGMALRMRNGGESHG